MAGTVGADAGIAEKGSGPEREISKEIVFKSLVFNRAFLILTGLRATRRPILLS
jgi:hypothetical protein